MARIVDALVSVLGYPAMRYSFRVSGLLRPCDLPRVLFFTAVVWPQCSRGSAMRRRVDVDLRHRRLLDCRGSCHGAFALAPQRARVRDSASTNAGYWSTEERRGEDGGSLNGRPVYSYRATRAFQSARRAFVGIHALRLLGTD